MLFFFRILTNRPLSLSLSVCYFVLMIVSVVCCCCYYCYCAGLDIFYSLSLSLSQFRMGNVRITRRAYPTVLDTIAILVGSAVVANDTYFL